MSKRFSFSVRPRYYRWLRYGAEQLDKSGSSLAEQAIERLMVLWSIPEPPDDWKPTPGNGRPQRQRKPPVEAIGQHFTF